MSSQGEITELLIAWKNGNHAAFDQLFPMVEKELHNLAHNYMRKERMNHTLQTTALINETYLKLVDQKKVKWENRAHFFGIAAQIMRRILLNYARDCGRQKRGGNALQISLSEADLISKQESENIIALDEALQRLAAIDERKSKVVELRYFGGLSNEEIAEVLDVSQITVTRDWNLAKAWLTRELIDE